jgi:hypothetical protein
MPPVAHLGRAKHGVGGRFAQARALSCLSREPRFHEPGPSPPPGNRPPHNIGVAERLAAGQHSVLAIRGADTQRPFLAARLAARPDVTPGADHLASAEVAHAVKARALRAIRPGMLPLTSCHGRQWRNDQPDRGKLSYSETLAAFFATAAAAVSACLKTVVRNQAACTPGSPRHAAPHSVSAGRTPACAAGSRSAHAL